MDGREYSYPNDAILVESDWLATRLKDDNIRVLDATVIMERQEDGAWRPRSGRPDFDQAHIPGAQFVDLRDGLVAADSNELSMMLPPPDEFSAAMSDLGIGSDSFVVIYVAGVPWWATRLWWMLRAQGHENVAVLNGGFDKWQKQGRPTDDGATRYPAGNFTARFRPDLVADKAQVHHALADDSATVVVNALSPQLFSGESNLGHTRPGRIAGSILMSALAFMDHKSGLYHSPEKLGELVAASMTDASGEGGVICYCGGGIAATMDAFVLTLLGHENVSVYDGSLQEWSADPEMPMATGT